MDLPNAKELAKLAAACRKAGITQFKGAGIEFTLSDTPPVKAASKKVIQEAEASKIENDDLPYEALLNWSVVIPEEEKADS